MSGVRLLAAFSLVSITFAATVPLHNGPPSCDPNTGIGCLPSPNDCPEGCICNRTDVEAEDMNIENQKRPSERVEFKFVKTVVNYGSSGISDENQLGVEDSLATKLHEKVEHVFSGIVISAILFIACACACVLSVCVYCCHIRQSDHKLKEEVDALAKKLKVDVRKPGPARKRPIEPIGESCNVVVQEANVMCV